MDLNELQSVRDRERQTDKLQQLRESFYADAGAFIQQLHAERDRAVERADDPFDSPEVRQLSDEIKTAEQTVEAIYEKRVGKIVKAASFAAADLPAEVDGMTAEEQTLFDNLVGNIKENRQQVLSLLDGEDPGQPATESSPSPDPTAAASGEIPPPGSASPDSPTQDDTAGAPSPSQDPTGESGVTPGDGVTAADAMGGHDEPTADANEQASPGQDSTPRQSESGPSTGGAANEGSQSPPETEAVPPSAEPVDPPVRQDGGSKPTSSSGQSVPDREDPAESAAAEPASPDIERQRVQILDDVETFLGYDDRDYDLEPDDVVSLPATNADILLERGVAREL